MTAEKMITKGEKNFSGKKNERSDLAVCGQSSTVFILPHLQTLSEIIKSFRLEKISKIVKSNSYLSTSKSTTKLCP